MSQTKKRITSLADAFGTLRNDYNAAKSSRYRRSRSGVSSTGSGADYHYRSESDYLRMMEQARDMDRNDMVLGQAVNRLCDNILQEGFRVDPATGDKKLDLDLWQRFEDWKNDPEQCDVTGEHDFHRMERFALRQTIVDGDMLALPLREGSLQLVEAHRVRTPRNTRQNVVHGVMLNERRRRIQYWFTKDDIDPMSPLRLVSDVVQVRTRDDFNNRQVFHIYDPKRITQTRGITAFAPIFDPAGMVEDINFAKMVQQQIVSTFAILRTRPESSYGGDPDSFGESIDEVTTTGETRVIDGVAPGMEIIGKPGEKIEGFSPNVPNAEFFDHIKLILSIIAVNLNVPLVMLMLDAKETNFSGWRGAVDQARITFREMQKWLTSRFHKQVYEWKVRQWIAEDPALRNSAAKSRIKILGHRWNPPTWAYIEPLKDAQGDALRMKERLQSPRRLHSERGADFDEIIDETIADNYRTAFRAIQASQRLETKLGVKVDWHEMLYIPSAQAITLTAAPAEAEESEEEAVSARN